jgi:hypothetical protein
MRIDRGIPIRVGLVRVYKAGEEEDSSGNSDLHGHHPCI